MNNWPWNAAHFYLFMDFKSLRDGYFIDVRYAPVY